MAADILSFQVYSHSDQIFLSDHMKFALFPTSTFPQSLITDRHESMILCWLLYTPLRPQTFKSQFAVQPHNFNFVEICKFSRHTATVCHCLVLELWQENVLPQHRNEW